MESLRAELSKRLDSLDSEPMLAASTLHDFDQLDSIILYLFRNIQEKPNLKVLRQLLIHFEPKVLEVFIQNPELLRGIFDSILVNHVDFDSSKLLAELFDESVHNSFVNQDIIDSLIDGLADSDEKTCENLVKVLILIGNSNLEKIVRANNSRFFGEMLVLRVNWAEGTEKKNLVKTIGKILRIFPEFFYLNDLKLVADTLLKVLNDRDEYLLVETYKTLHDLMNIQEFVNTRYRFDELYEILQHGEDEIALCEIQNRFMPYSQFLLSQTIEIQEPIPTEKFVCSHCADTFSTQRGLEIHVNKMHYNHPKTSVCTVCFKSFKNKYLLHTHNKQVHCKVLRVECVKCEKFFSSKFTLQKHLKKKHQTLVNIN